MSEKSETLRKYGRDLQASPIIATVLMGKFVVDCADDLERGESDLRVVNTLLTKANHSLQSVGKIVTLIMSLRDET